MEASTVIKVTPSALSELEDALEQYQRACAASGLAPRAQETYTRYASMFVRWVKDDFEPGARLK